MEGFVPPAFLFEGDATLFESEGDYDEGEQGMAQDE
jgi:hypothetical protein